MMNTNKWFLIGIAILAYQPRCLSEGYKLDPGMLDAQGAYFTHWDSVQDSLIMYRNTSASATPAVQVFRIDGSCFPIFPLIDLPESWYIDIWGVAATPEGGTVLAAVVGYESRAVKQPKIKNVLLTYDSSGKLTKVWDASPYHNHYLAVDRHGDVFALGDGVSTSSYPMVVKYSPEGNVLGEFLPSSNFADGNMAISSGSPRGDPEMFIKGEELFIWVGNTQELFRYSLAGKLLSRTSLENAFNRLASTTESDRVRVEYLTTTQRGDVIAQVQLWPKRKGDSIRTVLAEVSSEGSEVSLLTSPPGPANFLGTTRRGELVFLEPESGGGKGAEIKKY